MASRMSSASRRSGIGAGSYDYVNPRRSLLLLLLTSFCKNDTSTRNFQSLKSKNMIFLNGREAPGKTQKRPFRCWGSELPGRRRKPEIFGPQSAIFAHVQIFTFFKCHIFSRPQNSKCPYLARMSCSEQSIFHSHASDRVWFFPNCSFKALKKVSLPCKK